MDRVRMSCALALLLAQACGVEQDAYIYQEEDAVPAVQPLDLTLYQPGPPTVAAPTGTPVPVKQPTTAVAKPDRDGDGSPDVSDCEPDDPAILPGAAETCDGLDNDCDFEVDEGLGETTCGVGLCRHTIPNCKDGLLQSCDPMEGAQPEVCDRQDNDCDGELDEGLGETTCGIGLCLHTVPNCLEGFEQTCDPFEGALPEACDGYDNDCDGQTDEELGQTTCGTGACVHTVANCVGGKKQACDPLAGAILEVCDGVDNDCDGDIDEKLGTTTCGLGVCVHTISNCVDGLVQTCDAVAGASPEVCDGLDNDCDGQIDENLGQTSCGAGPCFHTVPNCVDGVEQVCDPWAGASPEVCDGIDNDCDEAVDEDFPDVNGNGIADCLDPPQTDLPDVIGNIPCLDYDAIEEYPSDPYAVTPATYDKHMQWIADNGYTALTFRQFIAYITDPQFPHNGFPAKPILIFSDTTSGWFHDIAWPILSSYGLVATIGVECEHLVKSWAMTKQELTWLESQGVEITSHSQTHPDLTTVDDAQLWDEVAGCKAELEALGFTIDNFIYPYGEWDQRVVDAVIDAGFSAARATGAADIRGGGYASFDPDLRYRVGCALPVTESTFGDFLEYMTNEHQELEDIFVVNQDVGDLGDVAREDFAVDHFRSIYMPDKGDSVRFRFFVVNPGTYTVVFRVKSGYGEDPTAFHDKYAYLINGEPAQHVPGPTTEYQSVNTVWGYHKFFDLCLPAGPVEFTVTSLKDWAVLLDWAEFHRVGP